MIWYGVNRRYGIWIEYLYRSVLLTEDAYQLSKCVHTRCWSGIVLLHRSPSTMLTYVYSYSPPATWNSVPTSIKNRSSLHGFKRHLKSHLIASSLTINILRPATWWLPTPPIHDSWHVHLINFLLLLLIIIKYWDGWPFAGLTPSAGHLSRYVNSHPGQLSLALPSWVGTMSTSQRAVMPCGWGVKGGMVHVWVAGITVWSPCYTRVISVWFKDVSQQSAKQIHV